MIGSNCCTRKYGARTLTANRVSNSFTDMVSIVVALEMPALDTRISSLPPTRLRTSAAST